MTLNTKIKLLRLNVTLFLSSSAVISNLIFVLTTYKLN